MIHVRMILNFMISVMVLMGLIFVLILSFGNIMMYPKVGKTSQHILCPFPNKIVHLHYHTQKVIVQIQQTLPIARKEECSFAKHPKPAFLMEKSVTE